MANNAVGSYKAERYVASLPFVCVFATLNACLFASVHASVCLPSSSGVLAGQLKRRKSSTAPHHMPNMGLSANLWGILASASKAEFLTEGDE